MISAELSVTLRGLKWSLYFWIVLVIHSRIAFFRRRVSCNKSECFPRFQKLGWLTSHAPDSPIIIPISGLRIANQKAAMAVKGPCVFTSYLFFSSCDEKLFFRKVLFLIERLRSHPIAPPYPSKEVLSALSCEATKNPPTASW